MEVSNEQTRPPDDPRKRPNDSKMAARLGAALGATMLIVGLTGSSWLRMRPQTPAEETPVTPEAPVQPAERPALAREYAQLASKKADTGKAAQFDPGFLRTQFGLAWRRLRGDPELAKLDQYHEKDSPAARRALAKAAPPPDWPKGFSPAMHAFKALAYATVIVIVTFSAAGYATCRYYDAWDPELLAYDIKNTMTERLRHIRPFFDRHLPEGLRTLKEDDRKIARREVGDIPPEWVAVASEGADDEDAWFTAAWWEKVNETSRLEEAKKQARLAILIEERNERARLRKFR